MINGLMKNKFITIISQFILIKTIAFFFLIFFSSAAFSFDDDLFAVESANIAALRIKSIEKTIYDKDDKSEKKSASFGFDETGLPLDVTLFGADGSVSEKTSYRYSKDYKTAVVETRDVSGALIRKSNLSLDSGSRRAVNETFYNVKGEAEKIKNYSYDRAGKKLTGVTVMNGEMESLEKIELMRESSGRIISCRVFGENMSLVETCQFIWKGGSCEIEISGGDGKRITKIMAGIDEKGNIASIENISGNEKGRSIIKYTYSYFIDKNKKIIAPNTVSGVTVSIESVQSDENVEEKIAAIVNSRARLLKVFKNPNSSSDEMANSMRAAAAAENDPRSIGVAEAFGKSSEKRSEQSPVNDISRKIKK